MSDRPSITHDAFPGGHVDRSRGEQQRDAIARLRAAITDAGPQPAFHAATMARHRREWPALWAAIDAVLIAPPPALANRDAAPDPR